jgi:hypothetical protein
MTSEQVTKRGTFTRRVREREPAPGPGSNLGCGHDVLAFVDGELVHIHGSAARHPRHASPGAQAFGAHLSEMSIRGRFRPQEDLGGVLSSRMPWVAGAFLALFLLETAFPLRRRVLRRTQRLPHNAALGAAAGLIERSTVLTTLFAMSIWSERRRAGVLSDVPPLLASALGVLLLDASMYAWHRINHRVPQLWRFHRVHHLDPDLDVSTALRFHPCELLASVPFRALQTLTYT